MKYLQIAIIAFTLVCCTHRNDDKNGELHKNEEIVWLYDWLEAWELISIEEFNLEKTDPPEMLFFDDQFVYTNSKTSAPTGQKIAGPKLYGQKIQWYRQKHNDTIIIPDEKKVPIQIMTFAAPSEKKNIESFFVMAAPSFWKNAGIDSEEVGLENMLTGVFLHEFAHTRQMNGIGAKITEYEKKYEFEFPVSDDIIQDYFSQDSTYVQLFRYQSELIYKYLSEEGTDTVVIGNFIKEFKNRQENFLKPRKKILVEMDKFFLTMEGIGQYAMVAWLAHPKGGGLSEEVAIKATRRDKGWWSQEEGLAWVLLYKSISKKPNWRVLFSKQPVDIIELIKKEIN